jgi:hypothetical protein
MDGSQHMNACIEKTRQQIHDARYVIIGLKQASTFSVVNIQDSEKFINGS